MDDLKYKPATTPEDCVFCISPSAFGKFVNRPFDWYAQQCLKQGVFDYNTSSIIGTVVHYVACKVAADEEVDERAIEEFIMSHAEKEDFVIQDALSSWYEMASILVNDYTLPAKNKSIQAELDVCAEVKNKVYAAGSIDLVEGPKTDCIVTDYKTYNSKTKPKTISADYRYQLLTYAWILKQKGYNVTRIRTVNINRHIDGGLSEKTGNPLKSYPPEITVLTETIDDTSFDFIQGLLEMCVDTLEASEKHPELRHVLWHDPRLKVES
jgi:ATP-dependent helicase/DNAse subunit B